MAKLIQSLLLAVCFSAALAAADLADQIFEKENGIEDSTEGAATNVGSDDVVKSTTAYIGILQTLDDSVNSELHIKDNKHQIFNGLVALILGIVMCADGEFVFRGVVVFCIFTFTSVVTTAEFHSKGLHHTVGGLGVHLISLEFSVLVAAAAYLGFTGIKVILGSILGFTAGYLLHSLLFMLTAGSALEHVVDHAVVLISFGSVFCVTGIWLLLGKHKRRLQAVLGCFFGGSLISSAVFYFAMLIAVLNRQSLATSMPWIKDGTPAWIDFLKVLLVPGSTQGKCGIFANSTVDASLGFSLDTILSFFLWFVLSFLGWKYQMKQEKQDGPCMTEKIVQKMTSTTQVAVGAVVTEVRNRSKTPPRTRAEDKEQLKMPLFANLGGEVSPRSRRPPV